MFASSKSRAEEKTHLNLDQISEIVYWTKKWEISPEQLLSAVNATKSNSIPKIEAYLRQQGFAL
jgi:hypothetical protein